MSLISSKNATHERFIASKGRGGEFHSRERKKEKGKKYEAGKAREKEKEKKIFSVEGLDARKG
mgnify:CR=1 FL=1